MTSCTAVISDVTEVLSGQSAVRSTPNKHELTLVKYVVMR